MRPSRKTMLGGAIALAVASSFSTPLVATAAQSKVPGVYVLTVTTIDGGTLSAEYSLR